MLAGSFRGEGISEDGTGRGGFPKLHLHDAKARRHADIEEGLGEILGSGIRGKDKHRLAVRAKDINQRVVLVEGHPVVEILVDPSAQGSLDVAEIGEHTAIVEMFSFDGDDSSAVVAVKKSAFAVVIDEAVPVAESEFFGDAKHRLPPFVSGVFRINSWK